MSESVHDAHCCKIHGCKYAEDDCPVVLGKEEGVFCEDCESDLSWPAGSSRAASILDKWFNGKISLTKMVVDLDKLRRDSKDYLKSRDKL